VTREPVSSPRSLEGERPDDDEALNALLRDVARAAPVQPEALLGAIASSNLVGKVVGDFVVTGRLGAGGMGVVYAAHDRKLGRRVALKVLAPRVVGDDRARSAAPVATGGAPSSRHAIDLLLREARAAAAITHPNVAAIYAAGEAEGLSYIAMEYVDGVTLRSALASRGARDPLPIADVQRYARQIADGLSKAHERRVVHRDLKPDNVMIDRDDRIKILDFGLARAAQDLDRDSSDARALTRRGAAMAGTPAYMSPEQTRGEPLDARTDVFSFGVLLYEALTGVVPFGDRNKERAAQAWQDDGTWSFTPLTPLTDLRPEAPRTLCAIVDRCLEVSPSRRFASAAALVEALDAAIVAPEEARAKTWRAQRQLAVAAVATCALMAVVTAWRLGRLGSVRRVEVTSPQTVAPTLKRLTANIPEDPVLSAALSPDGEILAFVDRTGLSVKRIGGRPERVGLAVDGAPQIVAWFPDGERLAVCTQAKGAEEEDLWVVSRSHPAAPRRIARGPFTGIAISPDGTRVAFAANDSVGWIPVGGEDAAPLAELHRLVQKNGQSFITEVAWSPDGGRIAYANLSFDSLAATAIETVPVAGDAPVPTVVVADAHLFNSFVRAAGVVWSSAGDIIYPRTEWLPAEAGSNLWSVKVDARTGAALSPPRRITNWSGVGAAALTFSERSDRIAFIRFESQADVYVADLADGGRTLGPRRRLTLSDRNERPSAWSKDGSGVYYFSDASGNFDIYFQDITGGTARPFAAEPEWETSSQLAPDGESLLYWRFPAVVSDDGATPASLAGVRPEIVRRPIAGGAPEHVLTAKTLAHPAGAGRPAPWEMRMRCPKRAGASCVLSEKVDGGALVFSAFDPNGARGGEVFRIDEPTAASNIWDVSPDGATLAIPRANGPILLQPIGKRGTRDEAGKGMVAREVSIPGCDPVTPAFSADGEGLFVSVDCNANEPPFRLYYVDGDGTPSLLWSAPSLFILEPEPSPDGKHLAIAVRQMDDDVWMIDGALHGR
jgi:serine/threonine protein kinase/Tol biopolymer transport system component